MKFTKTVIALGLAVSSQVGQAQTVQTATQQTVASSLAASSASAAVTSGNSSATGGAAEIAYSGNSSAAGGSSRIANSGNSANTNTLTANNTNSTGGNTQSNAGNNSTNTNAGNNSTNTNSGNNSTNAASGNTTTVQGDVYQQSRIPVAGAWAAPVSATNGTCMGSSSGGAQGAGFGISIASTWNDRGCDRRYNAQMLNQLGAKTAAIALMCQDESVREAMLTAGTPCKQ